MSGSKFYRLPGGFADSTDFVEVRPNGANIIHMKNGKTMQAGIHAFIEHTSSGGAWAEIEDPRNVSAPEGDDIRSIVREVMAKHCHASTLSDYGYDSESRIFFEDDVANAIEAGMRLAYDAARAARQPVGAVDLGQLARAVALLDGVSRTLVDWAAADQREAIAIIRALIEQGVKP